MPGSVLSTLHTLTYLMQSVLEAKHCDSMKLNPLPQVRLLPSTKLQPELGWRCKEVIVDGRYLPPSWKNVKRRANARISPAKMLLHRSLMSLSNILELSGFPFIIGVPNRERKEDWRSCCLACEHRKFLLRHPDSISL